MSRCTRPESARRSPLGWALLGTLLCLPLLACGASVGGEAPRAAGTPADAPATGRGLGIASPRSSSQGEHAVALLAGGCFWCLESAFDERAGVLEAVSGYAGGTLSSPSYEEIGSGRTGHAEVVRVVFDPKVLTYAQVLDVFWRNVDPFQSNGQFCDHGPQYRSAIFPLDEAQKATAEAARAAVQARFGKEPATTIEPAATFWRAEEYHQDFHATNPVRYGSYRMGCGRDRRLTEVWGEEAGK